MNNIKYIFSVLIVLIYILESLQLQIKTSPWMLTPELVKIEGYPCETYTVTTSDGYILSNYRIPNYKTKKPPVVLVHGLLTSSKDFMLRRNNSLALLLFNEGYDVWLLNMRYTEETKHLSLSRDDPKFWDFGFEENSAIDVAESIDNILNVTKSSKVIYISLSAGNAFYMMLCNFRPDLVDKFEYQISFGPTWFINRQLTKFLESLAPDFMKFLASIGLNRFVQSEDMRKLFQTINKNTVKRNPLFSMVIKALGGNKNNVDWENMHMVTARYMAISFKQFDHILQCGRSGVGFSRYDYGSAENIKRYGYKRPPIFNPKACTAPRFLYFGKGDTVVPLKEAKKLINIIRGPKNIVYLKYPKSKLFNHSDFYNGKNDTDTLYRDVIDLMKKM